LSLEIRKARAADIPHMAHFAVYPRFRGRGVASALLKSAEAEAVAQGFDRASLYVFAANATAAQLYERRGYRAAGRCPLVPYPSLRYDGDLLLMTKTL